MNLSTITSTIARNNITNKTDRKNKKKNVYLWELKRYIETHDTNLEIDIFPSTPEHRGIQTLKELIIQEMNHSILFEFDYSPMEKDWLFIRNKEENDDYLNLMFINNVWEEEYFLYSKRNFNDSYESLGNGVITFQ